MIFEIDHLTEYTYDRPVFLEPHTVRLRPRSDNRQSLLAFNMEVAPRPAGLTHCVDLDGNSTARVWFDGVQDSLTITTTSRVETLRENPFDYVLDPHGVALPMRYGAQDEILEPYRNRSSVPNDVSALAESIAEETDWETVPFISSLTRHIHDNWSYVVRPSGDPWSSSETLIQRTGSCRDLAVLSMECLRAVGLAVRFASGYRPTGPHPAELHAWVEVYLPGAGWRGYDPTTGLAVSDGHVVLATAAQSREAAPTSGTFRGTGASSSIRTEIKAGSSEGELRSVNLGSPRSLG